MPVARVYRTTEPIGETPRERGRASRRVNFARSAEFAEGELYPPERYETKRGGSARNRPFFYAKTPSLLGRNRDDFHFLLRLSCLSIPHDLLHLFLVTKADDQVFAFPDRRSYICSPRQIRDP